MFSLQCSLVRPFGIKPPIRHTIVTACVSGVLDLLFLELARFLVVFGVPVQFRTRAIVFGSISSPTQQLLRLLRYLATHGNVTKRYRCKRGGSDDWPRSPGCLCTTLVEGVATGHPKFWFASHRIVSEAGSFGRFHLVGMTTCLSFQWFRVQAVL